MSKPARKSTAKGTEPDPNDPAVAALGFEEAVEELERIVERMEGGESSLEESLREYARGAALVRRCRQVLDQAEQRIESIGGAQLDAGAEPRTQGNGG
ncbi:MAG: exodeoxyribonuclease VII small subunit [Planctomycetes bacterium]|nr:exodeoxyribonuclease VII small subunit [Planctomycetota bacterium]